MAEIVRQNPGSSEVQSPLIAGLSSGLWVLSKILNLTQVEIKDHPLKAVSIDSQKQNKNRIYEADFDNKLWLASPAPVIKKNKEIVQQTVVPYTIDYIGGSVTFSTPLADEDVVTVTCTRVGVNSTTVSSITDLLNTVQLDAQRYKGSFATESALNEKHSTATAGDFAIVETPSVSVFAWDDKQKKWTNAQADVDLSAYYTSDTVDEKLAKKENSIVSNGKAKDYYGGDKTFHDGEKLVRETKLAGLSKQNAPVSALDSLIVAIGKLQGQLESKTSYLKGNGAPSTSTKADIGQRYINQSNGDWYTCTAKSGDIYTWKPGQNGEEGMGLYPVGKAATDNNYTTPEKEKLAGLENYNDADIKSQLKGKISKINGQSPDEQGNIVVSPQSIGALGTGETAQNAGKLGGHLPAEFAKQSTVNVFFCAFKSNQWKQIGNTWVQETICSGIKPEYDCGIPWIKKTGVKSNDQKLQDALGILTDGYLETMNGKVKATIYIAPPDIDITIYMRRAL